MPEGPEIRLAADDVADAIAGLETTRVWFAFPRLKRFQKQLTGQTVTAVDTRGKAMLTRFDNGLVIYSHNQLYGKWVVAKRGQVPDSNRQLRLAIHNASHSAMLYSASDIAVLKQEKLGDHPFLKRIGPDLLSEKPTAEAIVERLQHRTFRGRQLGALLLDQRFVAGLGNYLRAEILLAAGIFPLKRAADLDRQTLLRLARAILRLTRRSYRTRGVVNPPSLVERLKCEGKLYYKDYRFSVYDRGGEPCYHCGTAIERFDVGGRHIYYCPHCQPD